MQFAAHRDNSCSQAARSKRTAECHEEDDQFLRSQPRNRPLHLNRSHLARNHKMALAQHR
jgi:hypothetical protein